MYVGLVTIYAYGSLATNLTEPDLPLYDHSGADSTDLHGIFNSSSLILTYKFIVFLLGVCSFHKNANILSHKFVKISR